jgi:hypothetical protein
MNKNFLLGKLPVFNNNKDKIVDDQSTGDIINAIVKAHKRHIADYALISSYFRGSNKIETCKNIFKFLKENIKYVIDSGEKQLIKSPAAILATGYCDCKCYALFAGGILSNLKIPFVYRFASYKLYDRLPGHVFVVVNPDSENEIYIDPVLRTFNQKKHYYYKIDKMGLYTVSGIGKVAKSVKKAARKDKKAAKKAAGKTLGQKLKKGAKVILKVAASPARNAFLVLVKINFHNLAANLARAWEKDPTKVQHTWEGLGGQMNSLKKAFDQGKGKKRILGCAGCQNCNCGNAQVGFAPAAAAAAAAPILIKIASLLKSIGIDPAELLQIGKDALNNKVQQLVTDTLAPKADKEENIIDVAQAATMEMPTMAPINTSPLSVPIETNIDNVLPENKNKMLPLYLIGGAAVLYLATRKK